jgi:membrane protease YdiL (CAAX protease family)
MENSAVVICTYCGSEEPQSFKFCTHCGKRNAAINQLEAKKDGWFRKNLHALLVYFILSVILLLFAAFTEETFETVVIWSLGFAFVDLIFAAFQPQVYKLFNVLKLRLLPLVAIIAFCIASGFIVSFSMEWLNGVLWDEVIFHLPIYMHLDHPLTYAIIFTAAFPAIFEEIAFRGFVYDNFKAIGGVKSAIWGSSFLFALVHFSLLSLVWILPFGLLLGYFRTKYSSLLYGMIGHFVHNTTVVLIEYYLYFEIPA